MYSPKQLKKIPTIELVSKKKERKKVGYKVLSIIALGTSLLCIVGELAGGVSVAVGVGNR